MYYIMFETNDGRQVAWSGMSYDKAIAQLDTYEQEEQGKPFPQHYELFEVIADTYGDSV